MVDNDKRRYALRYAALAAAASVLGITGLNILDGTANAVVMMSALAALGTLLARERIGYRIAAGCGALAAVHAGLRLSLGDVGDWVTWAYLTASLVLLACGAALWRMSAVGARAADS